MKQFEIEGRAWRNFELLKHNSQCSIYRKSKGRKEVLKVQKRICWIGEVMLKEERSFPSVSENIVKTKECCGR